MMVVAKWKSKKNDSDAIDGLRNDLTKVAFTNKWQNRSLIAIG
jgi:hypothetical protein